MSVSETIEDQFGFAEMNVLSFADLYAGKILAALDRQHPRDLFDIHQLLENEGIDADLRAALIVYLISHNHSPQHLLAPAARDIAPDFEHNFRGMVRDDITMETLYSAREALVKDVVVNMPEDHRQFLVSFYRREPKWHLLGLSDADRLPAVRWRELNLDKAGAETRAEIVRKLDEVLPS